MNRSLAVISAATLLCAYSALAQSQPLEFKGVPLGATEADLHAKFPGAFECSANPRLGYSCVRSNYFWESAVCKKLGGGVCSEMEQELFEFGPTKPSLYAMQIRDAKIVRISILLHTRYFVDLAAALVAKYGPATADETESVKNRMGAEFANRRLAWKRPDGTMLLKQRATDINTSSLTMFAEGVAEADAQERSEKAKAAAKKL